MVYHMRRYAAKGGCAVRGLCLALCLALLLCLAGCYLKTGDELYSLPQPPEDYLDLQAALNAVLAEGAEYAAPVAGSNRQSVQLVDLNADGVKEAVAFFRTEGERPLRLCVFEKNEGAYRLCASIDGAGSAIDSVEYINIDGRPGLEIIVGWQVSSSVQQYLGVYSLDNWRVTELMSAAYSEYCTVDLDSDGLTELFLLRGDADGRTGVAQLYRYDGSQMEKEPDVAMSVPVDNLRRLITGWLEPGVMAVFVASAYEQSGIVTDVFVLQDGLFYNASVSPDGSGLSAQTIRNYYIYADDIDSDGLLELPMPIQLPPARENDAWTFWLIRWYNLSLRSGQISKLLTFHNYSAGWYLELPDSWVNQITIYRTEGTSGWIYTIAHWEDADSEPVPMLHISPISGPNARLGPNWFLLGTVSDVTYAALITPEASNWADAVTEEELKQRFHAIRYGWNTGET